MITQKLALDGRQTITIEGMRAIVKDRYQNTIKEGDKVLYIVDDIDDAPPRPQVLIVDKIVGDNKGMFTTYDYDTRYFHGSEVIKLDAVIRSLKGWIEK